MGQKWRVQPSRSLCCALLLIPLPAFLSGTPLAPGSSALGQFAPANFEFSKQQTPRVSLEEISLNYINKELVQFHFKTRVPTDTCFCDKMSLFCYCHHNAREPPVKGAKCIMLVVLPSFAIYIGPNLPLSRFLKRNSSGNPKTVLKTPTDTYFCDKT